MGSGKVRDVWFAWKKGVDLGLYHPRVFHEPVHAMDYEKKWYPPSWKSEGLAYGMEANVGNIVAMTGIEEELMNTHPNFGNIERDWLKRWKNIEKIWKTSPQIKFDGKYDDMTNEVLADVASKLKLSASCTKIADALSKKYPRYKRCFPCFSFTRLPKEWK